MPTLSEALPDLLPIPVCLWKENPNRLVSLWDIMKPFHPHLSLSFVRVMETVIQNPSEKFDKAKAQEVFSGPWNQDFMELGLVASLATLEKVQRLLAQNDPSLTRFRELMIELQDRVIDEMSRVTLFLTDPARGGVLQTSLPRAG